MNDIVKCSKCLDSGWRLFVVLNTQQLIYIEPQTGEELSLPAGVKNYESCDCTFGTSRVRTTEDSS